MPRQKKRKVAPSVRRKISRSLKAYYQEQRRIEEARAQQRERTRRARVARRGWDTRRAREEAAAAKEAERVRKWRASYREYLKFKVPKKERAELKKPEKRELVCRVLYESAEEGGEEFWVNLRHTAGDSISNVLARLPAESIVVRGTFNLISGVDFAAMRAGGMSEEDAAGAGTLHELEWESDIDVEAFWESFYEHGRSLLPDKKDKEAGYNAASLLMVRVEVCYRPGEIQAR